MTTATKKSRAPGKLAREARDVTASEPLEFVIFEDNGGDYHWGIDAGDGATLARSSSYPSYEDAGRDMERVRDGAASARLSARFERVPGEVHASDPGAQ